MSQTDKMKSFLIKLLYYAIWIVLIYCIMKYAMPLFMPFLIAFGIAFLLKRPIRFLTDKLPLGRKAVAIILLTLVYLVVISLLVLLGTRIVVFLGDWFGNLPAYYREYIDPALGSFSTAFEGFLSRMDPALRSFYDTANESISQGVSSIVSSISSGAVGLFTGIAGRIPWFVAALVITIIASYFFVVDYHVVTGFIVRQLPANVTRRLLTIKDYVVNVLFKFLRAYFLIICITFVEVFIGLNILGMEHALSIAVITALVDILPVLGTGTIMLPWAAYHLLNANWYQGIGLLVLYAVITVIRQFLEPRIVGKQIGLYPLLTLICMFIGAQLFGFWGLFGLPIFVVVLIYLNRSGEIHIFKD